MLGRKSCTIAIGKDKYIPKNAQKTLITNPKSLFLAHFQAAETPTQNKNPVHTRRYESTCPQNIPHFSMIKAHPSEPKNPEGFKIASYANMKRSRTARRMIQIIIFFNIMNFSLIVIVYLHQACFCCGWDTGSLLYHVNN